MCSTCRALPVTHVIHNKYYTLCYHALLMKFIYLFIYWFFVVYWLFIILVRYYIYIFLSSFTSILCTSIFSWNSLISQLLFVIDIISDLYTIIYSLRTEVYLLHEDVSLLYSGYSVFYKYRMQCFINLEIEYQFWNTVCISKLTNTIQAILATHLKFLDTTKLLSA